VIRVLLSAPWSLRFGILLFSPIDRENGNAPGDNHPIHYDDEYAKTTRFGKRVTHGLLLTALTAVGASTLSSLLEGSIVAFVEQSARFLKPVFIGDTITPELEVSEVLPKTNVGLLRLTTRVKNQRGETVLEGMHAYLIKQRPRP